MPVAVKISPQTSGIASAPVQTVQGSVAIAPGSTVALDVPPAAVTGYSREGADLLVHLKSGELVRVTDFYLDPSKLSHLLLVQEDQLIAADVAQVGAAAGAAPTYVPMNAMAGFGTPAAAEAGAVAAGAAAGGSGLGAGLLIPLGLLSSGGIAAVASGGGGSDDPETPTTPPDTTAPAAATDLAFSAAGDRLTGRAEAGSTVRVDVGVDGTQDYSATVAANGTFTIAFLPALVDGQRISITARDAAGNVGPAATATAPDLTAPAPAQITLAADGTRLTGTGEPGATVRVDVDGDGKADYTTTIGANGTFTVVFTPPVDNGQQIGVTVVDDAGNAATPVTTTAPDLTPPPATAPVIDPSNGTEITGTAQAGVAVVLTDAAGSVIGQTSIDATGHWSFTPSFPLADGAVVQVAAVNAEGQAGPGATITVDALAPVAPVIDPTNGTTIAGTAEAGATVLLTDGTGTPIGQTTSDAADAWSFTPQAPLPDGTVVNAVARDVAGNTGPQASVTVDAVAPTAPLVSPPNATLVSGTAEPGTTVFLTDTDGNAIGQAVVDAAGRWSFAAASPLADGTVLSVTARDAAGNVGPATLAAVDAAAPAVPTIAATQGEVLSGTAEPGSTIILVDGTGAAIGQTTASLSGNWTFTPHAPLADGTQVFAAARDAAGNTGPQTSTTVDSTAPIAPVINPTNGVVVSGTAEAGALIAITDGDGNPIGQTIASGNGAWSFTPQAPLPDGTVVNAAAQDAAGNIGSKGTTTVDAVAPPAPVIDASNGTALSGTAEPGTTVLLTTASGNPIGQALVDGSGSWTFKPGSALPDGTVVNAVAQDSAGNASLQATSTIDATPPEAPVIDPTNGAFVTGSAEAGALLTLTDGNGNPVGQVGVDSKGNWSFTPSSPLPDGTVLLAVAQDAAGNASPQAAATVDATAPSAPVIAPTDGQLVAGSAEPSAIVTVVDGNGNFVGQSIVDPDGNWSITPNSPLPDGTVLNATTQDASGNVSPEGSATVDATPPAAPVIEPTDGATLAGSAEADALLTLFDGDGTFIGQVQVDDLGGWSFTPDMPLADGTVVNAVAQDAAGNTSPEASTTVDAAAPANPTINSTNGSEVTGTAEPNSTVILMDGTGGGAFAPVTARFAAAADAERSVVPDLGLPLGQVVADGAGNWMFTPLVPLPDGTVVIAVSVDAAGNVSIAVSTVVDGVAPNIPSLDLSNGLILEGTADAGAIILLSDAFGNAIGQTVADADGNWNFTPLAGLPDGTLVTVVAADEAGNISIPATIVVDALAPAIPVIAASNGVTLTGTAEADALVILTNALGIEIGRTTADPTGHWTFTPGVPLLNAALVNVVAQDETGNTSLAATTVIDSVAPAAPALLLAAGGELLTITAEPGSQVQLVIDGDNANPIVLEMGLGGTILLPLLVPVVLGETLSAVAIDAAGNTSPVSTIIAPDIAAPTIEVIEADDGYINSAEAADGIQLEVTLRPTMQAGQIVTARFDGPGGVQTQTTHTLTAGDLLLGAVVLSVATTGSADGAATVSASVGGDFSKAVAFVLDTTHPALPVLALNTSLLTIAAAPGDVLTVNVEAAGTTATTDVTANSSGLATVNLLTGLDTDLDWARLLNAQVNVTGEDAAGNRSAVSTLTVAQVIDTPPVIGDFALDVSLFPLSPRFGFTGTTEPGATVEVRVVTPVLNVGLLPIIADENGHFSVNLLSPTILTQLGLNITDILNLGSQISFGLVATDQQGHESASYLLDLSPNGLSLNLGQIDVNGTVGDDILMGSTGVEHMNGGSGNDLILNVGTGDHVAAGPQTDTTQLTATDFSSVDGGAGIDTVLLSNGIDLDYGAGVGTLANIERIDLGTGDSGSVLTLTAGEVDAITDSGNTLQITGDANDALHVTGAVDTGTTQTVEGVVYDVYTFGATHLLVEENSVQVVV
jgi:hypothetical protein